MQRVLQSSQFHRPVARPTGLSTRRTADTLPPPTLTPTTRSTTTTTTTTTTIICQSTKSDTQTSTPTSSSAVSLYEVTLDKPLGVKFARGRDGGCYVASLDPNNGNLDPRLQPGDKIIRVSASFGDDVWDALNFGQVLYAIKTRAGSVYLQIESKRGDMTALEPEEADPAENQFKSERAGGNYGTGTKEMQQRNYMQSKERERKRREMFDDALDKFRANKLEESLIIFENVISLEPKNYVSDNFARNTTIYRVAQYNVACCYSSLKQEQPALDALAQCLASGFDDYAKVRSDPNLAYVRSLPKFKTLVDKYDEPVINMEAINAFKNLFGGLGKK